MNDSTAEKPPPSASLRSGWLGSAFAGATVAVATLARLALDPVFGGNFPFFTYVVAVAVVAGYGRTRTASLTLVGGGLLGVFLFAPPRHTVVTPEPDVLLGLALYLFVGAVVVVMSHAMRAARDRAEALLTGAVAREVEVRRAMQAEAEQRERLRTTLASIGDAVITTDTGGRVTNLNPVAEALTGWANRQAAGQPLDAVFHIVNESTRQPVENPATRALKDGVIVGLANHTVLIAKDGTERPIDDSAAPIRSAAGEVVGCVLVFRDIASRREAERSLRESEERAAFVRRASGVGFWYCDLPFDVLQWDELVKAHFHLPPDAPVTIDTFYARIHPDDREPTRRAIERSIADRTSYDTEYRTVAPGTGAITWVRAIGRTFYAADGTPTRFDGVTLDVTEQKRAEERLRASEERYRTLFDTMDEGFCVIEFLDGPHGPLSDYVHVAANPAYTANAGIPDIVGQKVRELVPDEAEAWVETYRTVLLTGEPVRFQRELVATGRFLDLAAFRVEPSERRQVAVLFNDITARRRAEDRLRESEGRLRLALSVARMVAWEWTPADGRLHVSENAADVFGLPAGKGLTSLDQGVALLHPDDVPAYRTTFQRAIDERGSYLTRYRLVRPEDGRTIWIEEQGHTVFNRPGGMRLYGVATDVTDRVRAEEEVRDTRQRIEAERGRLAEVFRQAPAFLCVLRGPDHVYELVNDRYDQLVGHRELLGRTVREALPEVEDQGFVRLLDEVYRTGEPFVGSGVRVMLARQSGQPTEERYVDFVYQALSDPGGAVTGVVTVGVDVTDRRQAELAVARLAAASERQRRLFDTALSNTADPTYTFDLEGRFTFANQALLTVLGKRLEEVTGRTVADLGYPPALADRILGQVRQVIDTRQPVRDETPYTGGAGEREYDYVFVPVVGAGGAVEAVVGSSRDITDRKKAEVELLRLAADLSDADRRKDEFLATLAHELRNPLAPIRNGLQVIRLAGANGTVEQARSMMDRQVTQLVRLVDDLLDVSRITRGKLGLRTVRVELRAVIDAALETCRPLIDQAGHELEVDVPDEPIIVEGDLTRLSQVVSNLLTNSAKYTHRGGHIRLAVGRDGEWAVIAVKDTGIGIPPTMLDKVFVMFTQVDRTLEKTTGGLGIGLSLVKGLVEMHGGTIEARSDGEGKGSEFVVRLPVVTASSGGADQRIGRFEEVVPSGLRRILVVDDNADAADSLSQLLEMLGNEVRTAYDGEAGVAAAGAFRPAVMLCDIGMPKLNGYDAARRIREQPWGKGIVLVALTGWGQEDDRQKSSDAGFDHHLVKPVEAAALMKLLAGLPTAKV